MSITGWKLENSYAKLPAILFQSVTPEKVPSPKVVIRNNSLATAMGLDFSKASDDEISAVFAGQTLPSGALPIAQAYAGHQYGGFAMLGDGRAILLGEQRMQAGNLLDVQLKGGGRTPFSRMGDGKAALGPMLREYIISEAMFALGIPTTRSLAVVATGESVYRESRLPGAILTRVAASHIRVGTFQYLSARNEFESLRVLADYAIDRHYPHLTDASEKYVGLLKAVLDAQAALVAQWQLVGFVHGVLNTDNVSIASETIDYGPCAFMDVYHPSTVFSSIDRDGRYAYQNQPNITLWNMARFAETLLPLLDPNEQVAIAIATEVLNEFTPTFERYWLSGMRKKLGLSTTDESDQELIQSLLAWMQAAQADFTNTFDDLSCCIELDKPPYQDEEFLKWNKLWAGRLAIEGANLASAQAFMRSINPCVIARNHQVEKALDAATNDDDFSVLHELLSVVEKPFDRSSDVSAYQAPPPPGGCYRTFCGT